MANPALSPLRGILWMIAATMMLSGVSVMSKTLTATHPVELVLWGRFFFNTVILLAIFRGGTLRLLRTRALGLQSFRSVLMLLLMLFLFLSFHLMPLASAMGIVTIAPILVTLLAVFLLREKVSRWLWLGVFGGFAGALIIIRPGGDVVTLAALTPLAAAIVHASYQISTRYMAGRDPVLTSVLYTPLAGTLYFTLVLPWSWEPLSGAEWAIMVGMGLVGAASHFAMIKAFESAPASVVAPYYYFILLSSGTMGFLFFGEVPDLWTFVGAAIVVGSGLFIWNLEQRRRRARLASPS